ncbi:MAG: EMC3/TMCO1 family protein [Candidatus Bathyarchaeia archaeon]
MIDLLSSIVAADLEFLKQPPASTVFILALSAVINLVTGLVSRRNLNLDEYRRIMTESQHAQQELMAAMRSGNQRRISRAQRRQQEASQAQLKMSGDRMKTTFFFMIPILLMWIPLNNFYGKTTIAHMPFDAPLFGTKLNLVNWYFLSSITTSIIFQRILGLTLEIEPRDSSG